MYSCTVLGVRFLSCFQVRTTPQGTLQNQEFNVVYLPELGYSAT